MIVNPRVTVVDRPSWWARVRNHPLFDGLMWAVRFWVVGGVVVGCAYLLAPLSEAARSLLAPGRHHGAAWSFDGRTPSTAPQPAPEWFPTELADSTVSYARPVQS